MFLAIREIRHEPTRFALIVTDVFRVAYVTFFLSVLATGLSHAYRAAVEGWSADSHPDRGLQRVLVSSGSGKSTLLTVMGGLRTPSSGTVEILGEDFSSPSERRRARVRHVRIGFVLQAAGLVPFLRLADQFSLHDRVAIAVTLTTILMSSLPTSPLLPWTAGAQDVARVLADHTHRLGKAAVMVTHDERLLPLCDRVLVMNDGVLRTSQAR